MIIDYNNIEPYGNLAMATAGWPCLKQFHAKLDCYSLMVVMVSSDWQAPAVNLLKWPRILPNSLYTVEMVIAV